MLRGSKVIGTGLATTGLIGTGIRGKEFSTTTTLFMDGGPQGNTPQNNASQNNVSQNNAFQDNASQSNDFDNSRSNPASWSADNVQPDDGYGIDFIEEVKLYCDTPEKAAEYFKEKKQSVFISFYNEAFGAEWAELRGHLEQKELVDERIREQEGIVRAHHIAQGLIPDPTQGGTGSGRGDDGGPDNSGSGDAGGPDNSDSGDDGGFDAGGFDE